MLDKYDPPTLLTNWLIGLAVSLIVASAKVSTMLFGKWDAPPEEPRAYALWAQKRRWVIASEFGAVAAYPTFAVLVGLLRGWDVAMIGLMCMVLGMFGYSQMSTVLFRLSEFRKFGVNPDDTQKVQGQK